MASPRDGASPAGLPRVETLQTWDAWLTLSGSPRTEADAPARCDPAGARAGGDRLLDAVLVAPGLPRSMTVAHLQSAAGLLRDGYGTSEEQCRLELLCAAGATELPGPASLPRSIASGEVDDDDTDSGGDDGGALSATGAEALGRDGGGVAAARALIDRGLVARDTADFRRSAARQTAQLLRSWRRAAAGRSTAHIAKIFGGALGQPGGDAAAILGDLAARCDAEGGAGAAAGGRGLSRQGMLQVKHVVHLVVSLHLMSKHAGADLEDATRAPKAFFAAARAPAALTRRWPGRQRKSALLHLAAAARVGTPRDFVAPLDATTGLRSWARPADAFAAYEAATASRRGAQLSDSKRIWLISDVHVEAPENGRWLDDLAPRPGDAVIVAGDVATNLDALAAALCIFRAKFKHVFFAPGNHELWVMLDARGAARTGDTGGDESPSRPPPADSVDKLFRILQLCDELGVHTSPAFVGDALVVPLFSWYKRAEGASHAGLLEYFDGACAWPWPGCASSLDDCVADFFLALNEGTLDWVDRHRGDRPVISFSHFVPQVDSLFPGFVAFRHVMGCDDLDVQLERLAPRVHGFGHSHINVDEMIRGTRSVQQALGHPSDGLSDARHREGPVLVWSSLDFDDDFDYDEQHDLVVNCRRPRAWPARGRPRGRRPRRRRTAA
ncbi:calcineurin-like phosphoesterase [Aureococcus anophagefferens]|nr:calcineurin-like phosphoesterase [Aureococcus anophagefferens]